MSLDEEIRLVEVITRDGKIAAVETRKEFVPFLNREELELSVMQALIRINTRRALQHKFGQPIFSMTEYEKVIGLNMIFHDTQNKLGLGSEFVIIVSIDKHAANPLQIVKENIMPFVKKTIE